MEEYLPVKLSILVPTQLSCAIRGIGKGFGVVLFRFYGREFYPRYLSIHMRIRLEMIERLTMKE